jgi:hypothetical protein
MHNSARIVCVFIPMFTLLACDQTERAAEIPLDDAQFAMFAGEQLTLSEIDYDIRDGVVLVVASKDRDEALEVVFEAAADYLPIGLSISFEGNGNTVLLEKLNAIGIPYSVRNHDGVSWVVWSLTDDEEVQRLLKEIERESIR